MTRPEPVSGRPGPVTALAMRGIRKAFGNVIALRNADLAVRSGEIHALLGENGAGKSTLMHIAAGLVRPDAGAMALIGSEGFPATPRAAVERGVAMVHQHFTSIAALSVSENIALATAWPVRPAPLRARVAALLKDLGLPLDPDARAGDLSVGLRQRLEIAKALAAGPAVLLLDEPTGVLSPAESAELFRSLRTFVAAGGAAVLITHRLDEALEQADAITVLRQGEVTLADTPAATLTRDRLLTAMLGPEPVVAPVRAHRPPDASVAVAVRGLAVEREGRGGMAVRDVSLEVRPGEIVVVAAVEGNGQRELLRAIAGALPVAGGTRRVASPVAFIPEDRTTEALIGEFSLVENLALGDRAAPRRGWLDWTEVRGRAARLIAEFDVKAQGPDAPAASLSGGNQQKFVNARALDVRP
ncbi:MAG TPA: ATP-binding cassette domain-containing protein, partial [Gemmatimonadales bacterium]|nr:ATP-binding cassette domain-containing protein [Gemmatimonadales bacterium]